MRKYSCFDVKTKDHICSLILNRPNELNSMNSETRKELAIAFEELDLDLEVKNIFLKKAIE